MKEGRERVEREHQRWRQSESEREKESERAREREREILTRLARERMVNVTQTLLPITGLEVE